MQVLFFPSVDAQSTEQIWLEYKPIYSFANGYKLAMRASYRTNLEEPLWRVWEFRLMPEKKLSKHFDVLASLQFLETVQFKELTTSEIRLAAGGRYHFLPGRRVASGVLARVEFRNVYQKAAEEWNFTVRPRVQFFMSFPINEKTMSPGKVIYFTSFIEFFLQNEEDVQERYANRSWIRLGLGYKLNKRLKFELLYTRQDSKNTITDNFEDLTKENIFLFTLKHHLY